jgi:hypothetical protein
MLTISRPDVRSDEIVLRDINDRFLKLPIENYLPMLDIKPNAPQIAVINAVNDPKYRFITACLSRRVGKTFISNVVGNLVSLVPGANVLIMAPNYSLSTISWDLQKGLLRRFDIELDKSNAKDKIIELTNGSTIRVGSVSQPDSVVGRSYDLIIFDEAALADKGGDAFNIQLRPTLDKLNSKCIFISTPRGKNWFSTVFDRGFSEEFSDWVTIHADWHENPRALEADILAAQKSMSDAEWRQEYYADFSVLQGKIWAFNTETMVTNIDLSMLGVSDVIGGIDMGYKDPTAVCVAVTDGYNIYIVDEYEMVQKSTEAHAERIHVLMEKWDIDLFYIDSAAAQTRADLAMTYDITTIKSNKSVLDGIGFVASLIDNDRLKVDPRCVKCIAALNNYSWESKTGLEREKPKHNEYSHMADAIRYMIYSYAPNLTE